jgi:hypothetical protein
MDVNLKTCWLLILAVFWNISSAKIILATYNSANVCYTHTSFIENSIEAGNLLRGNDALHAMLGARTRVRMQSALVTIMFTSLIARLLY